MGSRILEVSVSRASAIGGPYKGSEVYQQFKIRTQQPINWYESSITNKSFTIQLKTVS